MTCKECFNWNGKNCDTMTAPFNDLSCFMSREQRMNTETELLEYSKINGNRTNAKDVRRVIQSLKERM